MTPCSGAGGDALGAAGGGALIGAGVGSFRATSLRTSGDGRTTLVGGTLTPIPIIVGRALEAAGCGAALFGAGGAPSASGLSSVSGASASRARGGAFWAGGGSSVLPAAGGVTACIPIIVPVDDLALRMTRPFDHNSSVWQLSQRTTACAGPFTTAAGKGLLQLGHAVVLTVCLRAPSVRASHRRCSTASPLRGRTSCAGSAASATRSCAPCEASSGVLKTRSTTFAASPASTSKSVMVTRTDLSRRRRPTCAICASNSLFADSDLPTEE